MTATTPGRVTPLLGWLIDRAAIEPEVLAAVAASAPASLATGADDPEALARALAGAEAPGAALRLIGAALPPREGVWWAWVAVRHTVQTLTERAAAPAAAATPPAPPALAPPPTAHAAVAAVERWIAEPSDANRRAAWAAGEAAELTTPAGCACAAVFFTGGSIASPQSPMAVPPPPGAHVTMAASAVLMAAAQLDPARLVEAVEGSIAQAAKVAKRLGGWTPAATLARQHFDVQREQHAAAVDASTPKAAPATPS